MASDGTSSLATSPRHISSPHLATSRHISPHLLSRRVDQFGDISKEIERRRVAWVKETLGKDDYQFGDLTKKALASFTGKDEYEFGDVTKRLGQMLFGNKQVPKKKD
jgi:hypothetical protein